MTATVTVYNGGERCTVTGKIVKRYANGLTVEDQRGVVYYATMDRVSIDEPTRGYLW